MELAGFRASPPKPRFFYDGSPFYPTGNVLFDLADAERMTLFGTSAKFISSCEKAGIQPVKTHSLENLRTITSRGLLSSTTVLLMLSLDQRGCASGIISGGTDIVPLCLGNPDGPVYSGEIQARGLGMAVEVYDDSGEAVRGSKGELVCERPFPSMPIAFGRIPETGGISGAISSASLGCGVTAIGLRLHPEEGIIILRLLRCGPQPRRRAHRHRRDLPPSRSDTRGFGEHCHRRSSGSRMYGSCCSYACARDCFLRENLKRRIKGRIRRNTTPHQVPAKILEVGDIPRTKSGKIVEVAVRDIVHGRPVKHRYALANPGCPRPVLQGPA